MFPLNAKKVRICDKMSGGIALKIYQCEKFSAVFCNFFPQKLFLIFLQNFHSVVLFLMPRKCEKISYFQSFFE